MLKKIIVICFTIVTTFNSVAQSLQIEGVEKRDFEGVFSIISPTDNSIAGYYTYYESLKAKKGIRTYQFDFMDTKLTKKNSAFVDIHKNAEINATVFNGKFLMVSFRDYFNKKLGIYLLDLNGKIVFTKEEPYDVKTFRGFFTYPAENGDGFYLIRGEDPKKAGQGFTVEKLDNQLKTLWTYAQTVPTGRKRVGDLVNANGRLVIWEEYTVKGKTKPKISCLDAKSGKLIYERDGYDGESTILLSQMRVEKDGSIFVGGAYVNGQYTDEINNDGIFVLKIDPSGKEAVYSKVSNKEKIQEVLKASTKGFTLGSKDKVFVEDVIVENDQLIVVTEMFRKNLNMTPAAIQQTRDLVTGKWVGVLGGTSDNSDKLVFEIMDYMIFKFDLKGNLTEMKLIAKEEYNKITVWSPYTYLGGMDLAKLMKKCGWFDYGFNFLGEDGKHYMMTKNNATPRKPEVSIYSLDKSYALKKVDLKQEAKINLEEAKVGYFNILPSDKGKFAAIYYQKKLDRITLNIESAQ